MRQTETVSRNNDASITSIVYLWYEIGSARALMWLANPAGLHGYQPHVHLYLADRYGRLAAAYRHRSKLATASRVAAKAEFHFNLGGGNEPPPAMALAVGIDDRQAVIDAEEYPDPTENEGTVLPFVPKKPTGFVKAYRR